jgi:hypothetical protein
MIFKHIKHIFWLITLTAMSANLAYAGPIISAKDAFVTVGGSFNDIDNDLANTYNQAGLYDGYEDNVTDFDSYVASNPYHTSDYNNQEWFSEDSFASVVFDLGGLFNINAVALWNEESAGIKLLDLSGSTDGINFFSLATGLFPVANPYDPNNPFDDYRYTAEVFETATSNLRFVKFDMTKCLYDSTSLKVCSIGEVAFRSTEVSAPQTLAILMFGLVGIAVRKRVKKVCSSKLNHATL